MTAPPEPLWDTDQVARHLQMSPRYVQQLVRDSRIPFVRFGRTLRFHPEEINAWIKTRQTKAVR